MTKEIKICLREYIARFYGNQKPNVEAMKRRCRDGKEPNAIKEGGKWFIKVQVEEMEKKS